MWRYCAVNEWSLLTLVQWKLIRSAGIYLPFFSHLTYVWFFHDYFGLRFFALRAHLTHLLHRPIPSHTDERHLDARIILNRITFL